MNVAAKLKLQEELRSKSLPESTLSPVQVLAVRRLEELIHPDDEYQEAVIQDALTLIGQLDAALSSARDNAYRFSQR